MNKQFTSDNRYLLLAIVASPNLTERLLDRFLDSQIKYDGGDTYTFTRESLRAGFKLLSRRDKRFVGNKIKQYFDNKND